MNNIYNNILFKLIGRNFKIVSTIDHPYTSPPIHLFDGHLNILQKYGSNALVLNWDVSLPGERTYRYDLITDTGLIAKMPSLYHYKLEEPYNNQSFNLKPLELLPQYIENAIEIISKKQNLKQSANKEIQCRAFDILDLAQKSYQSAPWLYTRDLLVNFYLLFNKPELSEFIRQQYVNYWLSSFMTKWIPWCIENVNGALSFSNVLNSGLFLRSPFRSVKTGQNYNVDLDDLPILVKNINNGDVIPSLDIFLWSLAVAGIQHYGSDFGFFQRLSDIVNIKDIAHLQITKSGEDALRFMRLSDDYGVLFSGLAHQHSKATRINSFSSLYVIGGDDVINYLRDYSRSINDEKIISLI